MVEGFLGFDGIIAMVLCVIERKVESNVRVLGWLKEKRESQEENIFLEPIILLCTFLFPSNLGRKRQNRLKLHYTLKINSILTRIKNNAYKLQYMTIFFSSFQPDKWTRVT